MKAISKNQLLKTALLRVLMIATLAMATALHAQDKDAFALKGSYLKIFSQAVKDGAAVKLLNGDSGTVEFWAKANWSAVDYHQDKIIPLFFWGEGGWINSIVIQFSGIMTGQIAAHNWQGQMISILPAPGWVDGSWHHVAIQWQAVGDKLVIEKSGLFVDGKRCPSEVGNEKQITGFDGKTLGGKLDSAAPVYFRFGAVPKDNKGTLSPYSTDDISFSQVRVSSVCRYDKDFTPAAATVIDKDALLTVNGVPEPKAVFYADGVESGTAKIELLPAGSTVK
jgi:hypothetical protein